METTTAATLPPPPTRQVAPMGTINKVIVWETNFNNKMDCQAFVHLDFAPRLRPIRPELDNTVIEIRTADNSHPPVKCRIYDLLFLKAWEAAAAFSFCSHGLPGDQFGEWFSLRHSIPYDPVKEMCVYFYQRV